VDRLKRFALFWYDFVIGDDWMMAAGVVVALVITSAAACMGVVDWLWLPLLVMIVLAASLLRATAKSRG
jgi:hypothetical protein